MKHYDAPQSLAVGADKDMVWDLKAPGKVNAEMLNKLILTSCIPLAGLLHTTQCTSLLQDCSVMADQ